MNNNSIKATDTYDSDYEFGRPLGTFVPAHAEARLAILRSRIDTIVHAGASATNGIQSREAQALAIEFLTRPVGIRNP